MWPVERVARVLVRLHPGLCALVPRRPARPQFANQGDCVMVRLPKQYLPTDQRGDHIAS